MWNANFIKCRFPNKSAFCVFSDYFCCDIRIVYLILSFFGFKVTAQPTIKHVEHMVSSSKTHILISLISSLLNMTLLVNLPYGHRRIDFFDMRHLMITPALWHIYSGFAMDFERKCSMTMQLVLLVKCSSRLQSVLFWNYLRPQFTEEMNTSTIVLGARPFT